MPPSTQALGKQLTTAVASPPPSRSARRYRWRKFRTLLVGGGSMHDRWTRRAALDQQLRWLEHPPVVRGTAVRIYMPEQSLDGRTGVVVRVVPGRYTKQQAIVKMDDTKELRHVPVMWAEDEHSIPCVTVPCGANESGDLRDACSVLPTASVVFAADTGSRPCRPSSRARSSGLTPTLCAAASGASWR